MAVYSRAPYAQLGHSSSGAVRRTAPSGIWLPRLTLHMLAPHMTTAPLSSLQGVRRGHWSQVRYRGDPLRRPIASYELAPLARLAVRASEAANTRLRLGQPVTDGEAPPQGLLQVCCLSASAPHGCETACRCVIGLALAAD